MQAVSRLYGRRIRGDIGPLNTDPATRLPGRILGPAVSLTGVYQDIHEEDAIQNFALGSRIVVDERTFHYCRAGAALTVVNTTRRLHIMADVCLANNDRAATVLSPIGTTTVTVDIMAGPAFQGGTVGLNELAGGWLEMWTAGALQRRRIVGNTAAIAGAPAAITVTIDRPLTVAVQIGNQVTLLHNIYRNVQHPQFAGLPLFQTAVCLPTIQVPNGHFFWGQTWGPCWIDAQGNYPGAVANFRDVYMWQQGETISLAVAIAVGGVDDSHQRVGYVLPAGNYGTGMTMLQLAP